MTSLTILDLSIRDIDVPADRARDYDEAGAQMLAGVIAAQGLHHPIRVRANGDRYTLISGLLRLRAFELLQRASIPASLSDADSDEAARLEEVMENLGRAELIALDRCHHLHELRMIHDAAHPNATRGGRPKSGKSFPTFADDEVFGLASTVADKVGLSKRAINMAVKIWTDLAPTTRLRLAGTKLATKQTELKALSEQTPPIQAKILDLILGDEHSDIENVAGALAFLEGGSAVASVEKQFQAVRAAFVKLPEASLDMLVSAEADRVIASLKRLGRI